MSPLSVLMSWWLWAAAVQGTAHLGWEPRLAGCDRKAGRKALVARDYV